MSPVQVNLPTGVFYDPGESFDFQFVLTGGDELGMLLVYCAQYVLSLKREWGLRKLGYPGWLSRAEPICKIEEYANLGMVPFRTNVIFQCTMCSTEFVHNYSTSLTRQECC